MKKFLLVFPIVLCVYDANADVKLNCKFDDNNYDVIIKSQNNDTAVLTINSKKFNLTKVDDFYPNADISYSTPDSEIGVAITKSARPKYQYIIKMPGSLTNPPNKYVFYPICKKI